MEGIGVNHNAAKASKSQTAFAYTGLPTTPYPVRMLHVSSKTAVTDDVEYRLEVTDLASFLPTSAATKKSDSTTQHFRALSYTWGAEKPLCAITIDGKRLEVRENLFDFLRIFQTQSHCEDAVWIDQLCIN